MKNIFRTSRVILIIILIHSCIKEKPALPTVTTTAVTEISYTTATSGGNVTNDGGTPVVSRGVCWNTSFDPTIENSKTIEGSGLGSFTSNITQLTPNTLFYLRAYATNSAGTAYGDQVSFTTSGTITDADGNIYNTITIGTQTWMKENLKTTRYINGTAIPLVTARFEWYYLTTPGYCWYDNNATNKATNGALYNWYAVDAGSNGNNNACPTGWHVPTDAEWATLITFLGGDSIAAGKLKETGMIHWQSPNTGATNETGFTALPGGGRDFDGAFYDIGSNGHWWSSTEFVTGGAWSWYMSYDGSGGYRQGRFEQDGFSVRCIKDNKPGK
ncbi:MAG: fibrobacter succinogenes major paralogous domain-containing protein [Bacteroidia bacterium]|nr:fibrobacter succinogenes major paralogous domain-containing protein [Bacteroidia bacterium]